jgi:hypothetical protein
MQLFALLVTKLTGPSSVTNIENLSSIELPTVQNAKLNKKRKCLLIGGERKTICRIGAVAHGRIWRQRTRTAGMTPDTRGKKVRATNPKLRWKVRAFWRRGAK